MITAILAAGAAGAVGALRLFFGFWTSIALAFPVSLAVSAVLFFTSFGSLMVSLNIRLFLKRIPEGNYEDTMIEWRGGDDPFEKYVFCILKHDITTGEFEERATPAPFWGVLLPVIMRGFIWLGAPRSVEKFKRESRRRIKKSLVMFFLVSCPVAACFLSFGISVHWYGYALFSMVLLQQVIILVPNVQLFVWLYGKMVPEAH